MLSRIINRIIKRKANNININNYQLTININNNLLQKINNYQIKINNYQIKINNYQTKMNNL